MFMTCCSELYDQSAAARDRLLSELLEANMLIANKDALLVAFIGNRVMLHNPD